jgi:phage replication-related protein YjqB (UPF0714/DUF867 family)
MTEQRDIHSASGGSISNSPIKRDLRFATTGLSGIGIMAKDPYNNFNELKQNEILNQDYRISISDRGSPITIIAPHGGKIEPKTSGIAGSIAGDKFNCYCFEGIKPDNNRQLHITSHNFDEPRAIKLIARSHTVVAVHACTDDKTLVYPGGRDEAVIGAIVKELTAAGIVIAKRNAKYQGINPNNICNRGLSGRGAQLEISRGLRDDLAKVQILCDAVHNALTKFTA